VTLSGLNLPYPTDLSHRPWRFPTLAIRERDWLLVNREDDAAFLAGDAVAGTGFMDHQAAGLELAVLVGLGTGQDQDMFEANMFVPGDLCPWLETEEGGGRTVSGLLIDPVGIDPFPERGPSQLILVFGDVEDILEDERTIER